MTAEQWSQKNKNVGPTGEGRGLEGVRSGLEGIRSGGGSRIIFNYQRQ